MAKKHKHEGHVNHERWLVSYADFITLLFATFTALYALSRSDTDKAKAVAQSMRYYFGSATSSMIPQQAGKQEFEEIKRDIENDLMTKGMYDKVAVDRQERGLVISMKDGGVFESGQADVKPEGYKILAELAKKILSFRNPVRIEGHTDNVPMSSRTFPTNWELSSARATNVVRVLTDKFGVPASKISATGYGDSRSHGIERRADAARLRILIVEDNPVNQIVAAGYLDRLGQKADVAVNGREAVEACGRIAYDFILMDCQMPVMDGFAATEGIRLQEGRTGGRAWIAALTALATPETRERCLASGMDAFLAKPLIPESLELELAAAMRHREARAAKA